MGFFDLRQDVFLELFGIALSSVKEPRAMRPDSIVACGEPTDRVKSMLRRMFRVV
jgi:hypothetical protein